MVYILLSNLLQAQYGTITLEVLPDELPEQDEHFLLNISVVEGGARISSPRTADVVVLANDFPVTLYPSDVHILEG